jgi:hypothetical protein
VRQAPGQDFQTHKAIDIGGHDRPTGCRRTVHRRRRSP